jgi:hypothetical protein
MPEKNASPRGIGLDDEPQASLPMGNNYLLVIGIDRYPHLPRLLNAVKDAREVANVLVEKYQFDSKRLFTLFDEQATQNAIIEQLKALAKSLTDNDNLLIYFAGHGEYDEVVDVGFWIPVDGRQGEIGSYIAFDLVTRLLRAIKTRHTFLITDSCYSGSFFTTRRATTAEDRLESLPSRWLLTAGRKEVVSDGWEGEHSPFAQAVLWHLNNNQAPRLRVSQFCNDILIAVGNNAEQLPRGAALQNVGDMGGEFMFRLKAYRDTVFESAAAAIPAPGTERSGKPPHTPPPHTPPPPAPEPAAPAPLRSLDDVRARLKGLLRQDDFKGVFELFDQIIDDRSRRENDIIMQQSQFNGINNQLRNGLVDASFANITFNRIRFALTSIVDELTEGDLKPGVLQPAAPPQDARHPTAYLDELERQGLLEQAETLQRKLNHYRQELATAYDANQKFALQEQIAETERQIGEIRRKLG